MTVVRAPGAGNILIGCQLRGDRDGFGAALALCLPLPIPSQSR